MVCGIVMLHDALPLATWSFFSTQGFSQSVQCLTIPGRIYSLTRGQNLHTLNTQITNFQSPGLTNESINTWNVLVCQRRLRTHTAWVIFKIWTPYLKQATPLIDLLFTHYKFTRIYRTKFQMKFSLIFPSCMRKCDNPSNLYLWPFISDGTCLSSITIH